jgi:hypothetical protein
MAFGQEGLVVTWTVPAPKAAKVTLTDDGIFDAAAKVNGPEVPNNLPKKYTEKLQKTELFNASMSWDAQELVRWEKRHGIEMEKKPLAAFEDYFKRDHVIFGALVGHPKVPDAARWKA